MKPIWEIEAPLVDRWRKFVAVNLGNAVVLGRQKLNVERCGVDLSRQNLWKVFVGCQVTTQQRTGPDSHVSRFLASSSSALNYDSCKSKKTLEEMLRNEFCLARLRRSVTMAKNLNEIFAHLESGAWPTLTNHLESLRGDTSKEKELVVADYLQSRSFPGLGPKQARNFLQWIGLSRYVVPLDSRVLKRLKEYGCTFVPRSSALCDESVYQFVESGVCTIANALGIYPCILDACIYSSFDERRA